MISTNVFLPNLTHPPPFQFPLLFTNNNYERINHWSLLVCHTSISSPSLPCTLPLDWLCVGITTRSHISFHSHLPHHPSSPDSQLPPFSPTALIGCFQFVCKYNTTIIQIQNVPTHTGARVDPRACSVAS